MIRMNLIKYFQIKIFPFALYQWQRKTEKLYTTNHLMCTNTKKNLFAPSNQITCTQMDLKTHTMRCCSCGLKRKVYLHNANTLQINIQATGIYKYILHSGAFNEKINKYNLNIVYTPTDIVYIE